MQLKKDDRDGGYEDRPQNVREVFQLIKLKMVKNFEERIRNGF